MDYRSLLQSHSATLEKVKALNAIQEKRSLTDAETKELESLYNEGKRLKGEILQRERVRELELASVNPTREKREFSFARAIKALVSGRQLDGYEAEVSSELEKRSNFPGSGIVVPAESLFGKRETEKRVLNAETALFSDPILPAETLAALREKSLLGSLGLRIINVTGRFSFPRTTGASAGWFAGDGTAAMGSSDPDYATVESRPKFLGVISGWSLAQLKNMSSDLSLESLVRDDLSAAMAEKLDEAIVKGSGASSQPTGITVAADVGETAKTYATTIAWALKDINDELAELRKSFKGNATDPKWLISADVESEWRGIKKFAGSGGDTSLLDAAMEIGPVIVTNHLNQPATPTADDGEPEVVLGQWDHFMLAQYDSVMLELGQINDDFSKGIQRLRAVGCYDLIVRRAEAFRKIKVDRKS